MNTISSSIQILQGGEFEGRDRVPSLIFLTVLWFLFLVRAILSIPTGRSPFFGSMKLKALVI